MTILQASDKLYAEYKNEPWFLTTGIQTIKRKSTLIVYTVTEPPKDLPLLNELQKQVDIEINIHGELVPLSFHKE